MRKDTAVLALAASVCIAILAAGAQVGMARTQAATATACGMKGLRFSFHRSGATYSDKVTHLNATGVPCKTARNVAAAVATDVLHSRKVPKRIDGLRVTVKRPCAGCAPDWDVSATSRAGKVTFVILGGA